MRRSSPSHSSSFPGPNSKCGPSPWTWNATARRDALIKIEGCPSGPGGTLVYFSCEDCATESARAVEAGGTIFKEKSSVEPYGFNALVQDSEGNLIGRHSRA
jgi:hypothetical protein